VTEMRLVLEEDAVYVRSSKADDARIYMLDPDFWCLLTFSGL